MKLPPRPRLQEYKAGPVPWGRVRLLCLLLALCLLPWRAGAADRPLTFGLPPYANPAGLQRQFSPLAAYLTRALGRPVEITLAANYISHVMNLGRGRIDIGYMGPSPYVKTKDKFGGIELLVRLRQQGEKNNRMVIVTRADDPATSLADLAGRSFAFGDYQSFGSHFLPRYLLAENGVPIKKLVAYDFVGSHDNVILSVLHGDFDAGGARYDIFDRYRERPLKIIYGPVPFPPHVIVCRSSLPRALKEKLKSALLQVADPHIYQSISPAMTGFAPVADRDFALARKVIDEIESR